VTRRAKRARRRPEGRVVWASLVGWEGQRGGLSDFCLIDHLVWMVVWLVMFHTFMFGGGKNKTYSSLLSY